MVNVKKLFMAVSILLGLSAQAAESDLSLMEKARALYAKGDLKAAIEVYNQVQPSSDFWLDSIEERAWAKTREGSFEDALADLQSIGSALWSTQVGPETYMLSTFVSLKICAYKDVIKKIQTFKKRMLPRVDSLQAMTKDGTLGKEFWDLAPAIQSGKVSMSSLGSNAEKYPRYFYRDLKLISALKSGSIAKVQERMKQLAQSDLDEINLNLKKMKIIEVELIQKVLTADKQPKRDKNLKFSSVDRNKVLIFPVDDSEEVWIDEVGHYQVKAEKCPFNTRSTL